MKKKQSKTTWHQRYKANKIQIESFKNFMFSEPMKFESRQKLLEEISRLEEQQKRIESMTSKQRSEDDISSISEKPSQLNRMIYRPERIEENKRIQSKQKKEVIGAKIEEVEEEGEQYQKSDKWRKMIAFANTLKPGSKYKRITEIFSEFGKDQFIKLYKEAS